MGKQLVIKDADFSAHAVAGRVNVTDITNQKINSSGKRQPMHYPNENINNAFYQAYAIPEDTNIGSVDVSQIHGRTIYLQVWGVSPSSNYQGGCWWIFLASSVTVTLPWTGTGKLNNAFVPVALIDGKGSGRMSTYKIVIPETANYLFFRDKSDHPAKVYLEDIDE